MKGRIATTILSVVIGLSTSLWAQVQTTTGIQGTVRDQTGAFVPGVTVTVTSQETGATREAVTSEQGYYIVSSLKPGVYTVSASLPGFKTAIVTDLEVLVAIPAQVNVTLEVGEVSETVTVSGEGEELINTTTAELATTIDQNLVESLPLESRNFFDLLALAPNTAPSHLSTGQMSFGQHALRRVSAAGSFESSGVFAGGNRDSATNVSIDGANTQIAIYNNTVNIQSSSTIKELRLQTASANAEFGYGANAVNVITKSGTNEYHGELFWQHRNDNLDATDFFTNLAGREVPEYKRNKFGGTLGGPILKNKLFFFGNYEGSRLRESIQGNTIVPSSELRKGDFSNFRPLASGGGLGPTPTIYNPFDFDQTTGLRRPFPGNKIPSQLLDPGIQKLLEYTPQPNTVIDNIAQFSGLASTQIDENQYGARIDWEKSERSTIYGRYTFAERDALRGALLQPLEGEGTPSWTHSALVNWTRVLTPTLINDFHASYSRLKYGIGRPLNVPDIAREMGLKNISDFPGSSGISLPNLSIADSPLFVWDPTQNTYQVKDDIGWTRGKHSLKFGMHVTERRFWFVKNESDKGQFSFDNIFSRACPLGKAACQTALTQTGKDMGGFAFADFLMGFPFSSNVRIVSVTWHGHQRYYGGYFQDTWQIHPRLTLNLGLRYEKWRPWLQPRNSTGAFDFSGNGRIVHALKNPLDVENPATDYGRKAALNPELPREGYETSDLNLAPRIGLAWTVTPDTVVRLAGGIFYAGNTNTNQVSAMSAIPPFTRRADQVISRSEQLPPLTVRGHFPDPSPTGIPGPFETPPASLRFPAQLEYPSAPVYQWSLSLQRRLSQNWSAHIDYLGQHNINNPQFVELNAAELPQGDLANVPIAQRRRLPGWGLLSSFAPWGYGKYHSGTFGLRNREWRGLSFMSNFTWSKNITSSRSVLGSDQGNNHYKFWDIWRGRGNFTPTARFISGWSYRLPFGAGQRFALDGLTNTLLGGWIVSGITEFSTGAPVTVTTSDTSGTGVGSQTADRVAGCNLTDAPQDRFEWFNTDCFVQPEFGRWGTAGQGLITDPGINNWNLTLAKTFQLHERGALEFRLEGFNMFNHTQWGRANTSRNNINFGRINDARSARQLQFALFYNF